MAFSSAKYPCKTLPRHLEDLQRAVVSIPGNGDCLFQSIAVQIHEEPRYTAQQLRTLAVNYGIANSATYADYFWQDSCGEDVSTPRRRRIIFENNLSSFLDAGVWNGIVGDLMTTLVALAANLEIVILKNNMPPIFLPHEFEVTDNSIIVVHINDGTHYNATRPMTDEEKYHSSCQTEYGSVRKQAENLNRIIVDQPVRDGDSFFISVGEQVRKSPVCVRKSVIDYWQQFGNELYDAYPLEFTKFLELQDEVSEKGFWHKDIEWICLLIIQRVYEFKYVLLLRRNQPPLSAPERSNPLKYVNEQTVVLVKGRDDCYASTVYKGEVYNLPTTIAKLGELGITTTTPCSTTAAISSPTLTSSKNITAKQRAPKRKMECQPQIGEPQLKRPKPKVFSCEEIDESQPSLYPTVPITEPLFVQVHGREIDYPKISPITSPMVATTSPYGQWGSQQQGFTPIEIDNSPALETSLYQSPEKEVRSKSCRQTALDRSRSLSPHKSPNSHSCRQRASSSKRTSPPTSCGKKQAHERSRTPSPYKSVMTPPHRSRGSASSDESPKPFKTPTTPARTPRQ